jgi:hypothetical protein
MARSQYPGMALVVGSEGPDTGQGRDTLTLRYWGIRSDTVRHGIITQVLGVQVCGQAPSAPSLRMSMMSEERGSGSDGVLGIGYQIGQRYSY